MNKIIEKYKDELGYIYDLISLEQDLLEANISQSDINKTLKEILSENKKIIKKLELENKKLEKIVNNKEKDIIEIDYKKSEKSIQHIDKTKTNFKEKINIDFYVNYIEENKIEESYLDILPNSNDKDSIKIIDSILAFYLKEINVIKYFIKIENDVFYKDNLINDLIRYTDIFNSIKKYKENLLYIEEVKQDEIKNELIYYMNGNVPFIYSDVIDSPNSYDSIIALLNSIENGTFKNIKQFTNNDKLRGVFEVRDLTNNTRIIFESLGRKKYCIIYAITDKRETNQLYKQKLILRYRRYCVEKETMISSRSLEDIKKLLKEV